MKTEIIEHIKQGNALEAIEGIKESIAEKAKVAVSQLHFSIAEQYKMKKKEELKEEDESDDKEEEDNMSDDEKDEKEDEGKE